MRYAITGAFFLAALFFVLGLLMYGQAQPNAATILLIGLIFGVLGLVFSGIALYQNRRGADAQTTIKVEDLPDTVAEAEEQLRREEDMTL